MIRFNRRDREYVQSEIRLHAQACSEQDFRTLCRQQSRGYLDERRAGALFTGLRAIDCLQRGEPLSVIRIGDGEGNILSLADAALDADTELQWFNAMFFLQDRQLLDTGTAAGFAQDMQAAVAGADILGVRAFMTEDWSELDCAQRSVRGSPRGALGMIRARECVQSLLQAGRLRDTALVSAWMHLDLVHALAPVMAAARHVFIITGRTALAEPLRQRCAPVPLTFVDIPLEAASRTPEDPHHFPQAYSGLGARLPDNLAGALVLVGAGIFGKHYCHLARQRGGVAIDLGSGFDVLAGLRTRPVHEATNPLADDDAGDQAQFS